jgi:hypothetical protein
MFAFVYSYISPTGPVVDVDRLSARYLSLDQSTRTPELELCAASLAMWAASFGIDPAGHLLPMDDVGRPERQGELNGMVKRLLQSMDGLSIMRKPTFDGMSALLLLLPMTRGQRSRLFVDFWLAH